MAAVIVTPLPRSDRVVEAVERKGTGHPDTICDALAEQLSRDLCVTYLARFGEILHHNVDKALLCGGRAAAAFRGGRVEEPIDIYLAGRASTGIGDDRVPVREIATEGARRWLRTQIHGLDADAHVRIHPVLRPGSQELRGLFGAAGRAGAIPRANDTSIGVGYAPLSPLEQLVLAVEKAILREIRASRRPAWGEDVKVMGVRVGRDVQLTISCAMIGAHLADLDAYQTETAALRTLAEEVAEPFGFAACAVAVNAADRPEAGAIYLTVTGTSAESGDDGQVGRGNRINGLITPGRPMSLEAAAGKNPVSHVGKIYNVAAQDIAQRIAALPDVAQAECLLVSRIGAPITEPSVAEVRVEMCGQGALPEDEIRAIVADTLGELPIRVEAFVSGLVGIY